MKNVVHEALSGRKNDSSLVARFQILNLVPSSPLQSSNSTGKSEATVDFLY